MVKKRKTKAFRLADAENLLKLIEEETIAEMKGNLTDNWRDNLFDILMTRLEIANQNKSDYIKITSEVKKEPKTLPKFAKNTLTTMHKILELAEAPSSPLHVIALSGLYASVVDVFLNDDTSDLAKTMAALDKRLGYFEEACKYINC